MPGALLLLALAAAAPAASGKPHFLLLPDLLKHMEKSPVEYKLETTDKLTDLDIADFGRALYPRRVEPVDLPQVEVRDGRRVVVRAPCEAIEPMRASAENLFQTRNYAAAGALYQEMMEKAPRCWVGFAYYGDSLFFAKRYADALPQYDKALALDPDEGALYTFRSNAYFRLGRVKESIDDLRWAIALRPHHPGPVKILSTLASNGKLRFHDVVFRPRAFARKEGEAYVSYSDPAKPYWLAYGACKALWLAEPEHRKQLTGSEGHGFTSEEELECVAALLAAYDTERAHGKAARDEDVEYLEQVAKNHDLGAWVVYELASRVNPQVVLTLPDDQRKRVYDFVKRNVAVDTH